MIKDMLKDFFIGFLKFLSSFMLAIIAMIVGVVLFGLGIKFQTVILLWIGGAIALAGFLWAAFLFLYHSDA